MFSVGIQVAVHLREAESMMRVLYTLYVQFCCRCALLVFLYVPLIDLVDTAKPVAEHLHLEPHCVLVEPRAVQDTFKEHHDSSSIF